MDTSAPYPLESIPGEIRYYLKATDQVQSEDSRIRELSGELVRDVNTEYDAVERILTFVVDSIHYVTPPARYDAVYSLESNRGNCQNFSHLSAALMRAAGIPVRIVNGVTLNKPLDIKREAGVITFKMGQGRHSWIEVWFPDLGWIPFDPQQTAMFVSNRFIRIEVGADNNETINDGLVRWSQAKGGGGEPGSQEVIKADFVDDRVSLKGRREASGPKNFLLYPLVKAEARPIELASGAPAEPAPGAPAPEPAKGGLFANLWSQITNAFRKVAAKPPLPSFSRIRERARIAFKAEQGDFAERAALPDEGPVIFGNIDFPGDIDFAFPPAPAVPTGGDSFEKTRSFFVETAEYVTSKRTQYAQVFIIEKSLTLKEVGLALHKFGGDGQLWIDLYKDNNGKPGEIIATSEMVDLSGLSEKPGYRWTDFPFGKEDLLLVPGNYWIGLGFTGSPIVNWFYTYGKPVGPAEGTRYKSVFEEDWSGALGYEFNYRVAGLVVK